MKFYTDSGVFLLKMFQLRNELRNLDEVVSTERLTNMFLTQRQLRNIIKNMSTTVFIDHSERLSTAKNES